MTWLYLVRHGETDWNAAHRVQGRANIPLNENGRAQARRAAERLVGRRWDAVFSSPLDRAHETARIIADRLGIAEVGIVDDLVERDYGEAEGMDFAELSARYPEGTHAPGQESRQQVADRVVPALVRIAEQHPGEQLLLVSHGGAIRSVLQTADPKTKHPPIPNTSVHSFLATDGALRLIAFDDPLEPGDALESQNAVEASD